MRISWLGKKYDGLFNWTDEELYCSELVWKLFHESSGIETGKLQQLRDFDLSSIQVKKKLNERYGNRLPLDEWVISPDAVFHSETLVDVP